MRLQGAISPRVEARLDEMLGHPEICPHGNPIDLATAKRRPAGVKLSEIEAGTRATIYRITEEAEEDAGLLSYLEARALKPGAPITILARSGVARFADPGGAAGSSDPGTATGRARPGPARRRRPGAIPSRADGHRERLTAPLVAFGHDHRPRPHRPEPDRAAPHRDRADRAVQLPARSPRRRGRSSCGSRTRTSRGARSRSRRTSSTACTGWAWSGTRARRWPANRPAGRTRRTDRWSACRRTRPRPSACWPTTWPIPASARPRSSTPTARPRRRPSCRRATSVGARR